MILNPKGIILNSNGCGPRNYFSSAWQSGPVFRFSFKVISACTSNFLKSELANLVLVRTQSNRMEKKVKIKVNQGIISDFNRKCV